MTALETIDTSKTEIMRLRTLIQTSSLYQKRIAEYMDYRGLEKELVELHEKYEELVKRQKPREEAKGVQSVIRDTQPKEESASP